MMFWMIDEMKRKNKYIKFKYILLFVLGCIIIFSLILGTRKIAIGNTDVSYFQVAGINFGIIKTTDDNLPVLEQLKSQSYISQFDAILEIKNGKKNRENVKGLIDYIEFSATYPNMKEMAVWALGEMREKSALDFLIKLYEESTLDKYEISKAIKKINKEYGWIERIKRQIKDSKN